MNMTDKPRVLFVDDNTNLLNAVKRVLRKQIELVTAESAAEALEKLESDGEFAVLVSDQNMPNMKGDALLAEAAKRWPLTVRVMLTGNDDQTTAISAVNTGQVFRFVRKPCDPDGLLEIVNAAAAHHRTITAEKQLLEQTLAGSVKVLSDILTSLRPDLFNRTMKVRRIAKLVAERMRLPQAWELDLAAMLYPLGMVAVPEDLAKKYASDKPLSPSEQGLIDQSTEMASKLISNIPRLGNVADGISLCRKAFDGSGFPSGGVRGKGIPFISRVLRILIDFVDATETGQASLESVGEFLKKKSHLYDPELLQVVVDIVDDTSPLAHPKTNSEIEVDTDQLEEGDIVLKDIVDANGQLLLASGAELTEVTIHRIAALTRVSGTGGKIVVSRSPNDAENS